MSGLIEAATAVMQSAQNRLEITSRNVANVSTAGYKRQIAFSQILASDDPANAALATLGIRSNPEQGKLQSTSNPLDLAISGPGYFAVRAGEETLYSRQGQFSLAKDGTVVTPQGFVLQQAGGGDLVLDRATVEIGADGTILDGDRPVGRIAIYNPDESGHVEALDGSLVRFGGGADEVEDPLLRQGMIEASNVSVGDEMVSMMSALREAEGGARLAQTYDDLLGRAITAFGQSGR